jgi:hypothetical protein
MPKQPFWVDFPSLVRVPDRNPPKWGMKARHGSQVDFSCHNC